MKLFRSVVPFGAVLRTLLGVVGAGSFGAGVVAVFRTQNGTGTGVLLTIGAVMFALAALGDRIETLEFGGGKLRLRAAAAERFALAEESEREGDNAAAALLRDEGRALLEAAGSVASQYGTVRGSMPAGPQRTRAMEHLMATARLLASRPSFEATEIQRWLREGDDDQRITALAIMQARPDLRDLDGPLDAIEHSRSAFEQYHAMVLIEQMIGDLSPAHRRRVAEAVKAARGKHFDRGTDRWRLSGNILERIESSQDGA